MTKERSNPLVSVHCAAYNHERYVEGCVRSVLNQTVRDIEMIVVDDGSSDATWARLLALAQEDQRLHVMKHEGGANLGIRASLRLAVDRSSAPFLARVDSDDRWLPDKLERQLPALRDGALLSYGRTRYIDEEGDALPDQGGGWHGVAPNEAAPGMTAFGALLVRNYIPALTAVFSRAAYERVGGYPSLLAEDYALWTRLVALADPIFVDAFLTEYRIHASQLTQQLYGQLRDVHADLEVLDDLRKWSDLPVRLLPVAESSWRCHRALVGLIDDDATPPQRILHEADAAQAALVIRRRLSRLAEVRGRARVYRWMNGLIAATPAFRRHIGAMWDTYLKERSEAAFRERRFRKALTFGVARMALKVNLMWLAGREAVLSRRAAR